MVGHHHVAPAAEHEKRIVPYLAEQVGEIFLAVESLEAARGAPQAKRGKGRERNLFLHGPRLFGPGRNENPQSGAHAVLTRGAVPIPLPIDPHLPEIVTALRADPNLVLEAPPGTGKTTRVPRAILSLFPEGEIWVLEPRRIAARMAARRVAEELEEPIGNTVGYEVRYESVCGKGTRIRFVTEGIMTRKFLSGGDLSSVKAVVFDEFHERHLETDLGLTLAKRLQAARPDFRIVVMSATLESGLLAEYLGASTLRVPGTMFPIRVEHEAPGDDRPLPLRVASAVRALAKETTGHTLVFLPGAREIREAKEACVAAARDHHLCVEVLHGELPPSEQDRVLAPSDQRKVILSTNIAESSLTIDGVRAVVDAGLTRTMVVSPWTGLTSLETRKASQSSVVQRTGRAGRTAPGICIRLFSQRDFEQREAADLPEIARADLSSLALSLRSKQLDALPWFLPPPQRAWENAEALLLHLGALDRSGQLTPLGKRMAMLDIHPRLARILVEGIDRGVAEEASWIAALLSERDPRLGSRTAFGKKAQDIASSSSDLLSVLDLLHELEGASLGELRQADVDPFAMKQVVRAKGDLFARAKKIRMEEKCSIAPGSTLGRVNEGDRNLLFAVLCGYPDRVAKRLRPESPSLGLAAGGRAELSDRSSVRHASFLCAVDADHRGGHPLVRIASGIEPEWLFEVGNIVEESLVTWDDARGAAESRELLRYGEIVLVETPGSATGPEARALLANKAKERGLFSSDRGLAFQRWLARARFAAEVDKDIVPPDAETIEEALVRACEGAASLSELDASGWLLSLAHATKGGERIEEVAPEHVKLPGGPHAKVHYESGKPPWIEAYLQDFFGSTKTPSVGRRALTLHLLAPNKRAVQVTSDLPGFWARHYPTIRKELMRKYPRHSWPEDPTVPTPRFRPRKA